MSPIVQTLLSPLLTSLTIIDRAPVRLNTLYFGVANAAGGRRGNRRALQKKYSIVPSACG